MTTPRFEDLPDEQQASIKANIEKAPALSDHQRERLQLLLRNGGEAADAP